MFSKITLFDINSQLNSILKFLRQNFRCKLLNFEGIHNYCLFILDIDFCVTNPCANGLCVDDIHSYTCDYNGTGYEGDRCENGK